MTFAPTTSEDTAPRRPALGRRPRVGLLWLLLLCILGLWAAPGARASVTVTLTPTSGTVCRGQYFYLQASYSSTTYGSATYHWLVDGTEVSSSSQYSDFSYSSYQATLGAHTVQCRVDIQDYYNGGTVSDTKTAHVTVVAPTLTVGAPVANPNPASLCSSSYVYVQFSAEVAETCPPNPNGYGYYGYGLTYDWNFGDGSSHDANPSPTHYYTQPGSYTVTLTVHDGDNGLTKTATMTEVVSASGLSVDSVTASPAQPTTCAPVQFSAVASQGCGGGAPALTWAFGDGGTGSGASPTHQYAQAGTYTATATASDGQGHSDAKSVTVTVTGGAVTLTSATSSAPSAATCADIQFGASATQSCGAGGVSYAWDFGDGSHAYVAGPVHHFQRPGTYTVTVKATGAGGGSDTKTLTETVTGAVGPISVTSETADVNPICPGLNVHFSAAATEGCVTDLQYAWTFGDGGTGSGASVNHQYASPGAYTVHVTATDPVSGANNSHDLTETVRTPVITLGSATATSALVCAPIQFSAAATADCVTQLTYTWTFGDNSPAMAAASGSHTYAAPGNYSAHLTVTGGSGIPVSRDVLVVVGTPDAHVSSISGTLSVFTCTTDHFSASVSDDCGGALTYLWDFGDGATSTQAAPDHRFATASPASGYPVTLTVTNAYGRQASMTRQVTVQTSVVTVSNLTATPSPGATCAPVTFSASAGNSCGNGPLTYSWDFGDGSPAVTGTPASHQYGTPGDYTVTLTVTDPFGGSGTQTKALHIDPPTLAIQSLTGYKNPGTNCRPVQFTAFATENCAATLTYAWDFGDGSPQVSGSQSVVSHQFAAPSPDGGYYLVSLTVTDTARGLTKTKTLQQIVTLPAITAGIMAGPNPVLACGGPVQFTGNASEDCPGTLTYHWDFGDGGTADVQAPSHQYTTASPEGGYTVTLTVTDAYGATKAVTYQETVTAPTITVQYDSNYPSQPTTCDTVSFNAYATDQCPDGQLTYTWDFGDGGAPAVNGAGSYYGGYASHRYGAPSPAGGYTATLTVTDQYEGRTVRTYHVTVVAPTITLSGPDASPSPAKTCDTVTFSAYGSENCSDYNYGYGSGLTYTWDFGDGTPPVTPPAGSYYSGYTTHQFAAEGTYNVQVRVTDDYHHADPLTRTVSVTVTKPTITIGDITASPDPSTTCSGPVSFSASVSEDCGGSYGYYGGGSGGALTYTWDFGDGTAPSTGNGSGSYGGYASHTYAEDDTYTVTLTVTDATYGVTASKTVTVTVNKPALTADSVSAYPNPANVGDTVTFYGSGHDDCGGGNYGYGYGGGLLTYSWDFGDGSEPVTGDGYGYAQHAYNKISPDGGYQVTLTITDPYSNIAQKTVSVEVNKPGERISVHTGDWSPHEVSVGDLITASASAKDNLPPQAQNGQTLTPHWTWTTEAVYRSDTGDSGSFTPITSGYAILWPSGGDDTTSAVNFTCAFDAPGYYIVKVKASVRYTNGAGGAEVENLSGTGYLAGDESDITGANSSNADSALNGGSRSQAMAAAPPAGGNGHIAVAVSPCDSDFTMPDADVKDKAPVGADHTLDALSKRFHKKFHGWTQPEYLEPQFTVCKRDGKWFVKIIRLTGHFSSVAEMRGWKEAGNYELTDPCFVAGDLRKTSKDAFMYFMKKALEDHEKVHANHIGPALKQLAPAIKADLETFFVTDTGQTQAQVLAQIRDPKTVIGLAWQNKVQGDCNAWLTLYRDSPLYALHDHDSKVVGEFITGPAYDAERNILDAELVKLCGKHPDCDECKLPVEH